MKTPEEIKKGLKACCPKYDGASWISCRLDCPYEAEGNWCKGVLHTDTLAYINQLEQRLAQAEEVLEFERTYREDQAVAWEMQLAVLELEKEQADRERDAAVHDLHVLFSEGGHTCMICDVEKTEPGCMFDCDHQRKWRGVCEENSKEENNG